MVSFEEYKNWINKYINNHDTREINFQNDVVKRLLEKLFSEYDIVSVDTKCCESKRHNYYAYSGEYIDAKNKAKPTTPDLLVCQNWDWYNTDNNNIKYISTIEVKSPYSTQAIYKKTVDEYSYELKTKIKRHLSAEKISRVILTDTLSWVFFDGMYDVSDTISLVNRIAKGRGYTYEWRRDAENIFKDNLINKLVKFLK